MIKKLTLLLFIIASTSCGIKQKPKFIKVDSIKLINANPTKITLSANALFNNPNLIGGRVITNGVKVYVNDISFGKIEIEEFNAILEIKNTELSEVKNNIKVLYKIQCKDNNYIYILKCLFQGQPYLLSSKIYIPVLGINTALILILILI